MKHKPIELLKLGYWIIIDFYSGITGTTFEWHTTGFQLQWIVTGAARVAGNAHFFRTPDCIPFGEFMISPVI